MFVEDGILTKLKNRVRKIYNNRKKYKFNIPGLVKYAFGQESKSETMMFCSQFVSKILEESGAAKLERDSSLYSPWQITSLKNIIHVEDDIISNFDKNRIDQIMDKISNDFRTSKYSGRLIPTTIFLHFISTNSRAVYSLLISYLKIMRQYIFIIVIEINIEYKSICVRLICILYC